MNTVGEELFVVELEEPEEPEEEEDFLLVVICGRVLKWSSGIIRTKTILLRSCALHYGLALRFSI